MPVIPIATGVWPKTSVKKLRTPSNLEQDVAESLGLGNLSEEAAAALAADVEFRLTQLIEDSIKFMRHSKRTNLLVEDVDYALRAKNIEPLWGFASTDTLSFRRTTSAVGNLYFIDEEEIDLTRVLNAELPPVPQETSYTAHWLAVEGVQPAIPQNPTAAELKSHPAFSGLQSSATPSSSKRASDTHNLTTKEHLSRELRLYFDRVTAAALSNDKSSRNAALASLSGDPGLHQLVPYLIQFAAEKITTTLSHTQPSLEHLRDVLQILESILSNPHSYLEPYLHQILPSILTCLLSASFPSSPVTDQLEREIRCTAGSLLKSQLNRYQHSYPTLRARILKTLTKSLIDPQSTDRNQLGAIIGVKCLGVEPTKIVLSQNIKAFGESLDLSLSEGKTDQNRVDNVIRETLKIMSEAYSEEQIRRRADSKPQKKLRSIPAQDELEAEVGVQFAARLMSTSDEEETKLAYTFIKESAQGSDTDDSDDEERSANADEEETIKMDTTPENSETKAVERQEVKIDSLVDEEKDNAITDPAPSHQAANAVVNSTEIPNNANSDLPIDEVKSNDNPTEAQPSNESIPEAQDGSTHKADQEHTNNADEEGDDMVLGSDNPAPENATSD